MAHEEYKKENNTPKTNTQHSKKTFHKKNSTFSPYKKFQSGNFKKYKDKDSNDSISEENKSSSSHEPVHKRKPFIKHSDNKYRRSSGENRYSGSSENNHRKPYKKDFRPSWDTKRFYKNDDSQGHQSNRQQFKPYKKYTGEQGNDDFGRKDFGGGSSKRRFFTPRYDEGKSFERKPFHRNLNDQKPKEFRNRFHSESSLAERSDRHNNFKENYHSDKRRNSFGDAKPYKSYNKNNDGYKDNRRPNENRFERPTSRFGENKQRSYEQRHERYEHKQYAPNNRINPEGKPFRDFKHNTNTAASGSDKPYKKRFFSEKPFEKKQNHYNGNRNWKPNHQSTGASKRPTHGSRFANKKPYQHSSIKKNNENIVPDVDIF